MWITQRELDILEHDRLECRVSGTGAELLARAINFQAIVKDSKWKCTCGKIWPPIRK